MFDALDRTDPSPGTPAAGSTVSDREERSAALDIGHSVIVQAPAGSGKTELLVMRYLALLAVVEVPEAVLAITFTKLAAAEMRNRILDALDVASGRAASASHKGAPELPALATAALRNAEKRGWQLHRFPSRLNIQTLDALALRIAQSMPTGAHSRLEFVPTEQPGNLYSAAATATLRALGEEGDPELQAALQRLLLHCDNNVSRTSEMLADLVRDRSFWLCYQRPTVAQLDTEVRPQLEKLLSDSVNMSMAQAAAACPGIPPEVEDEIADLMRYAAQTAAYPEIAAWKNASMPARNTAGLDRWRGILKMFVTGEGELRKSLNGLSKNHGLPAQDQRKNRVLPICDELRKLPGLVEMLQAFAPLPEPRYAPEEWQIIRALLIILAHATQELQRQFAIAGKVDFNEITLAAVAGLKERGPQQSPPLQHILVDEFQDTSLMQHEMLSLLISRWPQDTPNTIFLVGDPMQSIYAFRQAEVLLFERVRKAGMHILRPRTRNLRVNFRSHSLLVSTFNSFFQQVFANGREETAFVEGEGSQEALAGHAVHWIKNVGSDDAYANRTEEARQLCERLLPLWEAEKSKGDTGATFAILVRAKSQALFILKMLRDHGVPYRAIELEKLNDRMEIRDLQALASALLHPAERIAWLSVLRAPWCGLSMRTLETIVGLSREERTSGACILDLLEQKQSLLPPAEQARAQRVLPVLRAASAEANRIPLSQLLHDTWRRLGGPALVDPESAANVALLFQLIENLELSGETVNAESLAAAVDGFNAEPAPDSSERLQVMSIHKAKGLGFDYVFIPGTQSPGGNDRYGLMTWVTPRQPDNGVELFVTPKAPDGQDPSPLMRWVKAERAARADAELRRLLYVALTRARRQVFLFATLRFRKQGGELQDRHYAITKRSLLGVAWPAVEDEFLEFLQAEFPAHKAAFDAAKQQETLALAAGADNVVAMPAPPPTPQTRPLYLRRLPLNWQPPEALPPIATRPRPAAPPQAMEADPREQHFAAASWETRAAGTVTHALMEKLPRILARDSSAVQAWLSGLARTARILLQGEGVSPARTAALAANIQAWLQTAVQTPEGTWVFGPKQNSAEELPIAVTDADFGTREVRLDRTFLAGEALLSSGASTRWIIDYKTATLHGSRQKFLAEQQDIYAPHLRRYADAVRALYNDGLPVRAALYFPADNLLHEVALTPAT